MARRVAEEAYFDGENADILNLLARQGDIQREQSRYGAEEIARTRREIGQSLGAGVSNFSKGATDQYNERQKHEQTTEKNKQDKLAADKKFDAEEAKAAQDQANFNEKMYADKEQNIAQNKISQQNANSTSSRNNIDAQKQKVELGANLYQSAKSQEEIASADKQAAALGLNDQERATAKGIAAAAAQKAIKPPSEAERNTASFAKRAEESHSVIANLEDPKSGNYHPQEYSRVSRDLPLTGGVFKSPKDRQYEQAQKEFIAAILRKESGGAITPEEFKQYGAIYFPSAGDDSTTMDQKKVARERAINSLVVAGGEAYKQIPSTPFVAPKKAEDDTAYAAPQNKPIDKMSKEELESELRGYK